MILYFANRKMDILGHATTNLPEGFVIVEDTKIEEIDTGVATFSCRVQFTKENRHTLEAMTKAGNYLLRKNGSENEFYTIIDCEIDTKNQDIYIYAEDAGLDLLNEIVGAYEATEAHPASWYIEYFAGDSGFEIGVNEIPATNSRKLSWDGESTVTERLASVANAFGGFEVSYSFEVQGMEIAAKHINIYAERGKSFQEELRLNRDIDRIITKKSVANVGTALQVTGGIPDKKDKPITLSGYKYDDGDIYVDGTMLKSRSALKKWGRFIGKGYTNEGHIVKQYSYDTTSQSELCNRAITELKKICEMEVNYEIDITRLPDNIKIGDRVNIIDSDGELYLSARILILETSVTAQTQTATLGEYLIKESGISARVEELANQFSKIAEARTFYTWTAYADDANGGGISLDPTNKAYMGTAPNRTTEDVDISDPSVFTWVKVHGEDAVTLRIESSRGTVFKNCEVSTMLTVVIYRGSKRITNITDLKREFGTNAYLEWLWQKMGETTFGTILSTDSRISDNGFTFTLTPADVNTKVVFMCQLVTD